MRNITTGLSGKLKSSWLSNHWSYPVLLYYSSIFLTDRKVLFQEWVSGSYKGLSLLCLSLSLIRKSGSMCVWLQGLPLWCRRASPGLERAAVKDLFWFGELSSRIWLQDFSKQGRPGYDSLLCGVCKFSGCLPWFLGALRLPSPPKHISIGKILVLFHSRSCSLGSVQWLPTTIFISFTQ